jgi:hypothetical protein
MTVPKQKPSRIYIHHLPGVLTQRSFRLSEMVKISPAKKRRVQ